RSAPVDEGAYLAVSITKGKVGCSSRSRLNASAETAQLLGDSGIRLSGRRRAIRTQKRPHSSTSRSASIRLPFSKARGTHRSPAVESIMKTTTLIILRGDAQRNPKKPKRIQLVHTAFANLRSQAAAKRSSERVKQWPALWGIHHIAAVTHYHELSLRQCTTRSYL
ncbi:hypothetical protein, partial [Sinorhizobium alkalisoli]|uniref:hypothetical protein n=1 Tax=Sinorhizobium alkalisoli TaxID=1752398 RepID=UPI001A97CEFF